MKDHQFRLIMRTLTVIMLMIDDGTNDDILGEINDLIADLSEYLKATDIQVVQIVAENESLKEALLDLYHSERTGTLLVRTEHLIDALKEAK